MTSLRAIGNIPSKFTSNAGKVTLINDTIAGNTATGGNTTGLIGFDFSIGAKWLELLKQVAPRVTRAAVLQQVGLPDKRRSMVEAINLKPD